MFDSDYSLAELILCGFSGASIRTDSESYFRREKYSNFILFARNFESGSQLSELTAQVQALVLSYYPSTSALIGVDQEGGRVQRFQTDFTRLPSALEMGNSGDLCLVTEFARVQARELLQRGIQLNFAPVADLCTNPKNTVIGDRAYGSNPEQVANFVSASVLAHLSEGVQPCIKHFPGHGDTFLDSHEALPTVNTPLDVLRSREWLPFRRAIAAGCNFVMCGHLVLPVLDANFLTTFSSVILGQYLRKELNFSGVIVSDDLEMGAVVKNYTKDEIPVLALQAGCDLLCYRSEAEAAIALEAIKQALKERVLDANLLKKSIARTRKFKGMAGGITAGA